MNQTPKLPNLPPPVSVSLKERTKKREKLKELTATIKNLLITDVRYQENDALLLNRIQRDEMIASGLDVNAMSLNDFFRIRLDKRVSSGESITRIRREVQEYYPETRGDNYKKRQSKQADVISDLHEVENHIVDGMLQNKDKGAPVIAEPCDLCQGSGKYESFPCNVCNGTGEAQFK
jgi:hypothetical protein